VNVRSDSAARIAIAWSAEKNRMPRAHHDAWLWLCGERLDAEHVREAALAGAYDALSIAEASYAERVAQRLAELSDREPPLPDERGFIATCAASKRLLAELWRAARTSMPVLLTGETGTGKDLAARLLHRWSDRHRGTFVAINCAAVPNQLIESELFGYTRGAFSGAVRDYDGQLVAASGGTVFLDEIDDTPPSLQVKLLRVLEDHVVSRLGENVWRRVDFRIVAASNRDLLQLIDQGAFGADLYERLAIVSIELPPLRERLEELPALVAHMIARFYAEEPAASARGAVEAVSFQALALLAAYPFPGNIRELRNVIFEALVHKRAGHELLVSDLPRRVLRRETADKARELFDSAELERRIRAGSLNLRLEIERLEKHALTLALERSGWNASKTAQLLGEVGRGSARDPGGTVRAMMRRLGLLRRGMLESE
jgi:transcriptional regulator with PAS, ATPase and Fis domain